MNWKELRKTFVMISSLTKPFSLHGLKNNNSYYTKTYDLFMIFVQIVLLGHLHMI